MTQTDIWSKRTYQHIFIIAQVSFCKMKEVKRARSIYKVSICLNLHEYFKIKNTTKIIIGFINKVEPAESCEHQLAVAEAHVLMMIEGQ